MGCKCPRCQKTRELLTPRPVEKKGTDWVVVSYLTYGTLVMAVLVILSIIASGCAGRDYGHPSGVVKHADKPGIWCNTTKQGVKIHHVPPAPCPDLSDVEGSIRDALWRSIAKEKDLEGLTLVFVRHRLACGPFYIEGRRKGEIVGTSYDEAGNLHQYVKDKQGNVIADGKAGCYDPGLDLGSIQIGGHYRSATEYSVRHETCHKIEPNLPHWPKKRCFVWTLLQ